MIDYKLIGVNEKGREKVIHFGSEVVQNWGNELMNIGREVIYLHKRLIIDSGRTCGGEDPGDVG
jgi:hypothetical protein